MNTKTRMLVAAAGLTLWTGSAFAEVTANVGWVSDYIFRGVPQKTSSASAGLDFAEGGFYAGTWTADVGDGNEVDLYLGYGLEMDDFSVSVGGTGYFYTGNFDDTYKEANLSVGYGPFSVDYAHGKYDNFDGPSLTYDFVSGTASYEGFYGTVGGFSNDFSGTYAEAGYEFSVSGLDLKISWVWADKDLALNGGNDDNTVVLGITKNFTIAQ